MPQVQQSKSVRRKLLTTAAIVAALALVGGAGFWYYSISRPVVPVTSIVLNEAQHKAFTGDTAGAIAMLNGQLKYAKNDDEKIILYLSLGALYEDKNDNKMALAEFRKAERVKANLYGVNEAIARASATLGDKSTAIDYYKRNLGLINSGKAPENQRDKPDLEQTIKDLGGSV